MVDEVIGREACALAVTTEDILLFLLFESLGKMELLGGENSIDHPVVHTHISDTLVADWTRVAVLRVLFEASAVHEMTAVGQLTHRLGRLEQILVADRAGRFQLVGSTFVLVDERNGHARIALHAVVEIDP